VEEIETNVWYANPYTIRELISQIHIDNIDKENLSDIGNRINLAFVEPMEEYQNLQDNLFTDTIIIV
jgi:hypothetical protein